MYKRQVLFTVVLAVALASGQPSSEMGTGDVIKLFISEAIGGATLGLIAGYIGYRAMYGITESSLEVLITLALVMVTYSLALYLHMSGPIAMVVAGLFIGNSGVKYAMDNKTREHVLIFWTLIDEILNSVLFLLIGLEVLVIKESGEYYGCLLYTSPRPRD